MNLRRFLPDLSALLFRFPAAALAIAVTAVYYLIFPERLWDYSADNVALAGWSAFTAAGIGHLLAEGRGLARPLNFALAAALAVAAGGLCLAERTVSVIPHMLLAGLALILPLGPYLRRDASQGALWWFTARLALGGIIGAIVGIVFFAGVALLVESLRFLFGVDPPSQSMNWISIAAMFIVSPFTALSLVPRDLDAAPAGAGGGVILDRGTSATVTWLLIPLVLLFALVLHAYAVKIAATGALPEGQIGNMVSAFALGGTATWLIAWNWRAGGSWLLRAFMRFWFWLTPIPLLLLVLALYRRVADYGVTPDRYSLAIIALWIGIIAVYLAWRRAGADLRLVIGALAALLVVGSVGPWGNREVSLASQLGRLAAILETDGLLATGKLDGVKRVNPEHGPEISSIFYLLADLKAEDRLVPILTEALAKELAAATDRWAKHAVMERAVGISAASATNQFNHYAEQSTAVPLDKAATLYGPVTIVASCEGTAPARACSFADRVEFMVGERKIIVPAERIVALVKAQGAGPKLPLEFFPEPGIRIVFMQVYGQTQSLNAAIGGIAWLVIEN